MEFISMSDSSHFFYYDKFFFLFLLKTQFHSTLHPFYFLFSLFFFFGNHFCVNCMSLVVFQELIYGSHEDGILFCRHLHRRRRRHERRRDEKYIPKCHKSSLINAFVLSVCMLAYFLSIPVFFRHIYVFAIFKKKI